MNEVKQPAPTVDGEFEEIDNAQAETPEEEKPTTQAQVVISALSNGALDISIPEGMPELQPIEVERIVRQVYDEMHDMRVANNAVEIFKQRLG